TLALDPTFDGSDNPQLLAPGGTLAAGDTAQIRFAVTLSQLLNRGSGLGRYSNQAFASAELPTGAEVFDASDAGTDPDGDGDGDPGSFLDDQPTQFTVASDAVVGAAKEAATAGNLVTFDIYLESFGSASTTALTLTDDLDAVLGAGNYLIDTPPALIVDPGTLVLNGAYDGSTDVDLLSAGSSLGAGAVAQIRFVVEVTNVVDQGLGQGVYENQATVTATDSQGLLVVDLSHTGSNPDPTGDGHPTSPATEDPPLPGESGPTLFAVGDAVLGTALYSYVRGTVVTFDLILENLGSVPIETPLASLNLNSVFGSGNFSVTQQPNQIEGLGNLLPSTNFFGFGPFTFVLVGGSLDVGERARLRFAVNVVNVTDQGSGLGVYSAQITTNAFSADGVTPVSDVSDYGIRTDPNGNGLPMDMGESDATAVIIGEEAIVGVAKDAQVTDNQVLFSYEVENLGNVALTGFSMEEDLDAVFGAGNYTVLSTGAITPAGGPTRNPSFDGSTDKELFAAGGTLAAGAIVLVQATVEVTTITDRGLGLGIYSNQVLVTSTGPTVTLAEDFSHAGEDADPNGTTIPSDPGESDPTVFQVALPAALGVAKDAAVNDTLVTLDYYLANLGDVPLTDVSAPDDLDSVFGAGNYVIVSPAAIVGEPRDLVANGNFDGSSDTELVASGGLAAGITEQIRVVVRVTTLGDQGSGFGIYSNQVLATALDPDLAQVSDLSDAGTDPDANGNGDGDEVGENDPTPIVIPERADVGAALTASVAGSTVTFDLYLESFANVPATLSISEDLDAVFGAGNYTLSATPVLVDDPGTLVLDKSFEGSGDNALFVPGSFLAVGDTAQIRFAVTVFALIDGGSGVGSYTNQITVEAVGPGGAMASDLSDAGTDPDPNGDGDPDQAGENDPTPFTLAERPTVGVAKTATVVGSTVTFDLYPESFANVAPTLGLVEDLDAVFGAGNYTLSAAPVLVDDPGTLVLNGSFDGSGDTAILSAGSSLAIGDTAQIRFAVDVTTLIDSGAGFGSYTNQASLLATGPGGAMASDLSDSGTDPDPNGDGDPSQAGENDATPFNLAQRPTVGVAKTASVTGDSVTFDLYLESFANVPADLTLAEDLDAVFGAGNYTIASAPSLIDDPGTLTLDGAFDGSASTGLLTAPSSLAVGDTAQIRFTVDVLVLVDGGSGLGSYENQVTVRATAPDSTLLADDSDDGTDPDPNGDGDPSGAGENDATPFAVAQRPTVGAAKTASIDGAEVTLDLYLESFANVDAEIRLPDDLDSVFGAGNYTIAAAPTLVDDPGTLTLEPAFDGSAGNADLLAAGSTLAPGDRAQIRFTVEVVSLTDQGLGIGNYENQVTVQATSPDATVLTDDSDDGADPDPNGDGDPSGAGEADPTPITIADSAAPMVIGVETAAGPLATCDDVRLPLTVITVTIEDDLSSIQGADEAAGYQLLATGPDADFATDACGAPAGDDIAVPIDGLTAELSESGRTAVVDLQVGAGGDHPGLEPGLYRLLVCDSIEDSLGNALDGDGNLVPGGDFVVPFFRADPGNLFANGHFDDCPATLAPWF
ncbi:MAG: hypothetical protein MI919_30825, partial [Holophagales bacterium]|nr:hypothetical protein [Holophagales bacterium]